MKQDRFLLMILGVIGILMIVAIGIFFVRRNSQTYVLDDSPEGVIRNYVLAINLGDYEKAYGYLASSDTKPDFEEFERRATQRRSRLLETSIRIKSVDVQDNEVTVLLEITDEDIEPFDSPRSYTQSGELILQEGAWKIVYLPYSLWY